MVRQWQLKVAEKNLNRVIEDTVTSGPQIIIEHGVKVAVVISPARYQELVDARGKLSTFFRESPLAGVDLDLARCKSQAR